MNLNYLDFEQPIAELEGKIEELQMIGSDNDLNISEEIERLREKSAKKTEDIYSNLTPWQIVQVARHPQRPYTADYIPRLFDDWDELHGDRHFGDDKAIIGGIKLKIENTFLDGSIQNQLQMLKNKLLLS